MSSRTLKIVRMPKSFRFTLEHFEKNEIRELVEIDANWLKKLNGVLVKELFKEHVLGKYSSDYFYYIFYRIPKEYLVKEIDIYGWDADNIVLLTDDDVTKLRGIVV